MNSERNGVERNGVSAVFLPAQPDAAVIDLLQQAHVWLRPGLRIYTNGRQLAVLPAMLPGWSAFMARGS